MEYPPSLLDELDLQQMAPLDAEQIYYLGQFLLEEHRSFHHDTAMAPLRLLQGALTEDTWDQLIFYINTQCPRSTRHPCATFKDVVSRLPEFTPFVKYSYWAQIFPDPWFTYMNYGYYDFESSNTALALSGLDSEWRFSAQLYDRTCALDLEDKEVLEIGCGRGGGAAFLVRTRGLRKLVGLDGTRSNIKFCRRIHQHPRLTFIAERAEQLSYADNSFDVVVNIESCMYYQPLAAFFRESYRVLRRGGYLCIALYESRRNIFALRSLMASSGFDIVEEEDITDNVREAMRTFSAAFQVIANHNTVRGKKLYYHAFSRIYNVPALNDGRSGYYRFALRRL